MPSRSSASCKGLRSMDSCALKRKMVVLGGVRQLQGRTRCRMASRSKSPAAESTMRSDFARSGRGQSVREPILIEQAV
eukprot:1288388-Pyramimonas_sp.AAC.1